MTPRRGPRPTADRVRRLLVLLPWLMERREVAVAEVAAKFGLSEAEVVRDLELASMCGLPPFVDELIELVLTRGGLIDITTPGAVDDHAGAALVTRC